MERRGFQPFATAWWHFDWHDWSSLPGVRDASTALAHDSDRPPLLGR